jgi:molybdate transport system substrate-binding protein
VRGNTRRGLPSFGVVAFVRNLTVGILLLGADREVFAVELHVLAAGATESILRDMVGTLEKESGQTVKLIYAPVGALRDKIFAGEPADLTLVAPVIIEQLQARGVGRPSTRTPLGQVGGGIAVRVGVPLPAVATPEELKHAVLGAQEIYYADPTVATVGA